MGSTKIKTIEEVTPEPTEEVAPAVVGTNKNSHSELVSESSSEEQSSEILTRRLGGQDDNAKESEVNVTKKAAKKSKPKKGHKTRSKAYLAKTELVEKTKRYSLMEAIDLARQTSFSKNPGSLEVHIMTNSKGMRGLINMPHLSGKNVRVLAFGPGAEAAGADLVGDDAKLDDLMKGRIDFDIVVAHPSWMPKLARAAKVLGPKGMMPNPKNGTVSENLEKAIAELKSGKFEYKTESNLPVMHLQIGDLTQPDEELAANIKTLASAIGKTKLKSLTLAASMGLGVRVDTSSLS